MQNQSLTSIIFKGVALAMGVAAVVLGILGGTSVTTLVTLLGIGLFCLALWALQKSDWSLSVKFWRSNPLAYG